MNTFADSGRNAPPPRDSAPNTTDRRCWYLDEIVVAVFALFGFGCGVILPVRFGFTVVPPIVVSFLLATGIAALAYRYLGGIEGASFTVGALKLGGSLAALVGIAMLINSQLVKQIDTVQVWYLEGHVTDDKQKPINSLNDADFTVFPGFAKAGQMGDFQIAFLRDSSAHGRDLAYLTVSHSGFGPITVPLEPAKLKDHYPDATIDNRVIQLNHIVLPRAAGIETPYRNNASQPPQPLQGGDLSAYTALAGSAETSISGSGGVRQ